MKKMKSEELDERIDAGEDVSAVLDVAALRRPGLEQRRVNVAFPASMVEALDPSKRPR